MDDDSCPICGSKMVDMSNIPFPHVTCPKCGCPSVTSAFDAGILEKRGSKFALKRDAKSVTVDYVCEACGHKWTVFYSIKDGVFKVVGSKV